MRFATAIASLLTVGLAAAASRRSTCAAQNILDACLASTTPQLKACEPNDWSCLCEQSNNVLTCYNNCPGDDGQFGAQQTKTSYCNAANAYTNNSSTSSSHSAVATATSSDSSASETGSATGTGKEKSAASSTSTSSSSHSTSSGAAAVPGMNVQGGFVAALALGLAAVL